MKKARAQRWLPGAWLLLALAAAACTQWQPMAGEGALTIVIPGSGSTTKAASDITPFSYEVAVNRLQLLLFRDDGTRCDYLSLDASSVSFPYTKQYPSLGAGTYRIYAVANGPDLRAVTTERALSGTAVSLADLTGEEVLLDAYCGTGTIGLAAASSCARVLGVEISRDAVQDAVANAKANGIRNAWFTCADAVDYIGRLAEEE